jgi:hypothetical protein
MNTYPLSISIACKDNAECFYSGEDLPILITVKNNGVNEVEVPLAFIQKTGPTIKLTDSKESRTAFLKKNLADPALLKNPVKLAPGKSISIDWILTSTELEQFGDEPVDLTMEAIVQSFHPTKTTTQTDSVNSVGSIRIRTKPSNK